MTMTNLDADQLQRWNQAVVKLIGNTDVDSLPEYLIQALEVLVPSDTGMIVIYGEKRKPLNVYDNVESSLRSQHVDAYFEGAYLLDPYYRAGINGIKSGFYSLADVAPTGFRQSEYYKNYYRSSRCKDEAGYITQLPDGYFANTSLVNIEASHKFSKIDKQNLNACQPVIDEVLNRYWAAKKGLSRQDESLLHSQLQAALSVFAKSVLTRREQEVIQMYLHGHSTKSIAERLFISEHTVALHRKNSYAKLGINSQAEMFHLFIDSLSCIDSESMDDPLVSYFSTKGAS